MNLAGNTLANLEIFQNETDYTARGSLMYSPALLSLYALTVKTAGSLIKLLPASEPGS